MIANCDALWIVTINWFSFQRKELARNNSSRRKAWTIQFVGVNSHKNI